MNMIRRISLLIFLTSFFLIASGCIRLFGKAGYFKETPQEKTEHVVGFDTAKAFEEKQTKGSVTT